MNRSLLTLSALTCLLLSACEQNSYDQDADSDGHTAPNSGQRLKPTRQCLMNSILQSGRISKMLLAV